MLLKIVLLLYKWDKKSEIRTVFPRLLRKLTESLQMSAKDMLYYVKSIKKIRSPRLDLIVWMRRKRVFEYRKRNLKCLIHLLQSYK